MHKKQRLQTLFNNPGLDWIRRRLYERVRRGKELEGSIILSSPNEKELTSFANLTGRPSKNRKQLTLSLSLLGTILRNAELADNLAEAIYLLEGTVENERSQREQLQRKWSSLFQESRSKAKDDRLILDWLESLERSGLLKRLSRSDLDQAQRLIDGALAIYARLPADQIALPTLAAQITGDSHALDYGQPLAGLTIPLLASLKKLKNWQSPEERRKVWGANGVLCDALSHPLLVCNLHLTPSHPLSNILESAYELAEPTYLTIRQLSRFPIQTKEDCRSAAVYVCENPAIISANIETNGQNSKPLICTSGNLTSSAQILLRQLSKAGIEIYYHGDFDWPGLKIANYVIKEFGAIPWKMDQESYANAKGEKPLAGAPIDSPWEPKLKAAMLKKGTAVYEEQVVETLLTDLRL